MQNLDRRVIRDRLAAGDAHGCLFLSMTYINNLGDRGSDTVWRIVVCSLPSLPYPFHWVHPPVNPLPEEIPPSVVPQLLAS